MKKRNSTFIIMRRELCAYFTNPAAYIVTGLFLVFSGILFFSTFFLNGRADLRNFFSLLPMLLSLFVPALTMRLFSEELRSGSFETLMTLPVTEAQVVLGKFLAAFITSAAMLCPTIFYAVTARVFGQPDIGPLIGGYIGSLFLCAAYSAVGIFASGTTKNQIIAFFEALAICFALTLLGPLLVFLPAPLTRFFLGRGHDALSVDFARNRGQPRHSLLCGFSRAFHFADNPQVRHKMDKRKFNRLCLGASHFGLGQPCRKPRLF